MDFASLVCLVYPTEIICRRHCRHLQGASGSTLRRQRRYQTQGNGGSSEGAIIYFASEISANPTVAAAIPGMVQGWVLVHGSTSTITIYSNLSDGSGAAWGCGFDNCRILDQLLAY
jgi:hypothetical protein